MRRRLGLLLVVAILLVGCSTYEREMVPPKIDLGSSRRIAVLFFDNLTDDYPLVYEVEERLSEKLGEYYRVTEPREADWALARVGLRPTETPSVEQARRLGELLKVDAFVFGEVSGYFEHIIQTRPYPLTSTTEETEGGKRTKYELAQSTTVMVSFTGRVMSARSGNVIHRGRAQGEESIERKVPLGWYPEGKEPKAWDIPRPSRMDVPDARRAALREAVDQFTQDLLPTYIWRKVEE